MTLISRATFVLGILAAMLAVPAEVAGQADRFVGTWASTDDFVLNVTTMQADGRFRTEQFAGLELAGTIEGRWELRGNSIAWIYLNPALDKDDVNPILSSAADRFTLRETDGSESTFFRKTLDPASPELLPISVGTGWILEEGNDQVSIRISGRETFGGQDCYRVDWIDGPLVYQTEYWSVREDGVWVVGRRVLKREFVFQTPYRLVPRKAVTGERWTANVVAGSLSEQFGIIVGPEEEVTTPSGRFRAVRINVEGLVIAYRRWYARGVGLVREEPVVIQGARQHGVTLKNLKRRVE